VITVSCAIQYLAQAAFFKKLFARRRLVKICRIKINKVEFPHYNVLLVKILAGDSGDNIFGIEGVGEKTIVKYFPQMMEKPCTIEEILDYARNIPQKKPIKSLSNILTGKSKSGILGEDFYRINKQILIGIFRKSGYGNNSSNESRWFYVCRICGSVS